MLNPKRAVIYARYSSDNQREESIEGQLRECRAFAKNKGYTVIKSYEDRALTAKNDKRPQFQKMIKDSAQGEFNCIIVWKFDRFARNKYDSAIYKERLNQNNVKLLSATEVIPQGAEGIILESLLEGMAEYYSVDLSEKVSRGMTENCINGKFNGGLVTYGYDIDKDGHFIENPLTAPIVTEIFTRYADGDNIRVIMNDLTERGIKGNKGRDVSYHFINGMLRNRRYIGEYTFNGSINTSAIPPLITEDIFDKCQERLDRNKHRPASFMQVGDKYLLTGKIFCGMCGDTMAGVSGTGKGGIRYRYYQCMTSRHKGCAKKTISKQYIEKAVTDLALQIFDDTDLIDRITDACYKMQSTKSTRLPALKKELKQTEKEIENVMKAIRMGIVTKTTKSDLERLEEQQEKIEIEISREKMKNICLTKEQIRTGIMYYKDTDLNSEKSIQRLIDTFVNSIHVYDDKIVVLFNYKDGEHCITLDEVNGQIKKSNTHRKDECSTLVKFGDPYGS